MSGKNGDEHARNQVHRKMETTCRVLFGRWKKWCAICEEWIGQGHGEDGQNFDSRNLPSSSHMHGGMSDIPTYPEAPKGGKALFLQDAERTAFDSMLPTFHVVCAWCTSMREGCQIHGARLRIKRHKKNFHHANLGHSLRLAVRAVGSASRLQRHTGTASSSILVTCGGSQHGDVLLLRGASQRGELAVFCVTLSTTFVGVGVRQPLSHRLSSELSPHVDFSLLA